MQTGPSKRMGKRAVTVLCFIAAAFLVCVGSLAYISLIPVSYTHLDVYKRQP